MTVLEVFGCIRTHLGTMDNRLRCFSAYAFQAEGWLKGECVALLDHLKRRGEIAGLEREVSAVGRKKIALLTRICKEA